MTYTTVEELKKIKAVETLLLDKSIDEVYFRNKELTALPFFDKEGFELTELEELYLKNSWQGGYLMSKAFGHRVTGLPWYDNTDFQHPYINVDHSFLSFRFGFTGQAREQIRDHLNDDKMLIKLLKIKPKYGLDVALEFVTFNHCFELLHVEEDFSHWYEFVSRIGVVQNKLEKVNWHEAIDWVHDQQSGLKSLASDDQSDLLAQRFGFDRTYKTIKTV